ncbi:serine/threonine-protein kinase [Lentisphaera profundi]|uniref:Serine/threonine-protein kinase n=1 Tax=Lentisphaera profundi TaxID=1658616 RepID=A0ABY7VZR8_9BACT|nr:serine/threonine-protein kinase [Lentisphaera profundi]WDE98753.1 serine/threonine-protein kinase [Lentisphaera profundi]
MNSNDRGTQSEVIPHLLNHFDAAFDEPEQDYLRLLEELEIGDERYDVKSTVNEGGMKYIVETYDELTKRSIAKAVMKNADDQETVKNFIREARITASLEHPNIVPVHDIGIENEAEPFFTMKLLHGENLQDILDQLKAENPEYQKRYPKNELLGIFLKVCNAVAFAHSKFVLHLDLKPANIQVNEFGEVLLCDWGLARQLRDKDDEIAEDIEIQSLQSDSIELTQDGVLKGSPGYMAPEQITSSCGSRSYATDIYCLGAILYSILTLERPFSGNLKSIVQQTLSGEIIPPNQRKPDFTISNSLNAVVVKAMATKVKDRYLNVDDLADEVKAFIEGFATEAEHAGFLTLLNLLFKRHKEACLLISASFLIIILITATFMDSLQNEREAALAAEAQARQSQKIEKEARENAESAKIKAEKADARSMQIRKQTAVLLLDFARNEYQKTSYQHALKLVQESLVSDPKNMESRYYHALYQFGFHNFPKAIEEIDKYQGKLATDWLKELCKMSLEYDHEDFITSDTFPKILHKLHQLKKNQKTYHHFLSVATYKYPLHKRWEFAEKHLKAMCVTDFTFKLKQKKDLTYSLSIAGSKGVHDLIALNNLPISELDASNTDIDSIQAMATMPLTHLNISRTHVYSLLPLEDKKIKHINIWKTNVRNIRYLSNAPLETIYLNNKWSDLTFIQNIPTLRNIYISRFTFSESKLNQLPKHIKVSFVD